ncbi:MAG: 2-hydroxyacid dehydrogenase [Christensenellaceae bacterium]|jgi:D-lactate dehydrogenase
MKIAFFDTKPYDKLYFAPFAAEKGYEIDFFEYKLKKDTAQLTKGYDVVCVFVNDSVDEDVINTLYENGVRLIALRSAGYNHVDFKAAFEKIHVVRVPEYSPAAIAEHAAALLLSINRKVHRAYVRTRENNFSINGLMGFDLRGKKAGVIGTGKIGRLFIEIMRGFGMDVIAYDPYPLQNSDIVYVSLDTLLASADIISMHCPLTPETHHMINKNSIAQMKKGVLFVNTSRGALVDTPALIDALKAGQIGAAGLDVYEEEERYFFEDFSDQVVGDDELTILLSLPNVLLTAHQAFFTKEAMETIARVTIDNIASFAAEEVLTNEVCYQCQEFGTKCKKEAGAKRCF